MKKYFLSLLWLLILPWGPAAQAGPASDMLYSASFNDLDGQPVKLDTLRGKVAVVNFWATWCPPCRRELPDLVAVHGRYRGRGVAFIGIAVEDNAALVREFARTYDIVYPLVTGKDRGIALMQDLGNAVAGLPYTLVLDASGSVVAMRRGPMDEERLEQALRAALSLQENARADSK